MAAVRNGEIQLTFGSDLRYLDLVQDLADNISRLLGLDSDAQYWIGLSVRESVTNAVLHGNASDPSKKVEILFSIDEGRLVISVKDEGKGVDLEEIPDPLDPDNILRPGGRGIFFIRSFMDNVRFQVYPEGGHAVIMEKNLETTQGDQNANDN